MRLAIAQTDIAWEQVHKNLQTISKQSQNAAAAGCDLCLFPEMALCGFSMRSLEMADACREVPDAMAQLAQAHKIWLGTTYPEQRVQGALPFNTFLLVGPQGQMHRYRKMHPFSMGKEHAHYQAGNKRVQVEIAGIRCSLFVCYDLRFANAFWESAPNTDAYLVLANWPKKRRRAWNTLLRARAIENQAYVVGCNRVGIAPPSLLYTGDSCVIDPVGQCLVRGSQSETLLTAEINAETVATVRRKLPFLQDRRSDL